MYDVEDENRFWSKVETSDDKTVCWNVVAMSLTTDGYGRFRYLDKTVRAHRFSFELQHNRKIKKNMVIMHSCNNPCCVNPTHLSEGTNDENMEYMVKTGQSCRGSNVNTSKLNKEQVDEIRHKYKNTDTSYGKLAKEYSVHKSAIANIIKGKNWKHTFKK